MNNEADFEQCIETAIGILNEQDYVPHSPGETTGKEYYYCAAAALVRAGEIITSRQRGLHQAIDSMDSEMVIELFTSFGWDENLGREIMSANDSTDPVIRKKNMKLYLNRINRQQQ